jgi:hypothetical protein
LEAAAVPHRKSNKKRIKSSSGFGTESRFVQSIQKMHRTRAGGAEADAEAPGVLGNAACHESGRFFVPNADIANAILAFA